MLLLGAAQHRVNEGWVMANAASRGRGVPRVLLGATLLPKDHCVPCLSLLELHGCGLLEGGCLLPKGCLLPSDAFLRMTPALGRP